MKDRNVVNISNKKVSKWAYRYIMFALSCLLVAVLSVITLAMNYESVFPKFLVRFSHWMEGSFWFRTLWTILIVLPVMTAEFIDMIGCDPLASSDISNITIPRPLDPMSTRCLYPTYYTHFHILALIGITVLVPIDHMAKMITMTVMTAAHCVLLTLVFPKIFKQYDVILFSNSLGHHTIETKFFLCGLAATITVALFFFNQHIEMMSRKLFLWNEEADEQKMQVERLRSKNQTLLYNLLPVHVAREFIGVRKKDDDLYSHSYDEVGTMFAACPNYNDFYTENAVNNNGLECLRFLNEIISDYDELLHDPRFSSITKIKTVGPTYMAASGMSEDKISSKTKSITDRWQHLDDLVQFAFAMKEALNKINSQSFNNFILRIGINHGPIVAGVIGVRKPHYDIWGNTVNVSSRMESTGQVGKIQIVEETMLILKEFGYTFEKRGLVKIKGKGELLTYFLKDKSEGDYAMPNQVAPF